MSTPDRLTDDGQANDCPHLSASGVDTAPIGPEKVWRCDHCGLSWVDQGHGRAARLAAQPPATDRDALVESYASFWWAENSGETETWEELHSDEREAVVENSDAEAVVDWVVGEVLAARPALADRVQALEVHVMRDSIFDARYGVFHDGPDVEWVRRDEVLALLAGRSDASPEREETAEHQLMLITSLQGFCTCGQWGMATAGGLERLRELHRQHAASPEGGA